jgi:hypothetical protein
VPLHGARRRSRSPTAGKAVVLRLPRVEVLLDLGSARGALAVTVVLGGTLRTGDERSCRAWSRSPGLEEVEHPLAETHDPRRGLGSGSSATAAIFAATTTTGIGRSSSTVGPTLYRRTSYQRMVSSLRKLEVPSHAIARR